MGGREEEEGGGAEEGGLTTEASGIDGSGVSRLQGVRTCGLKGLMVICMMRQLTS
jgi:hypothetical protein